MCNYTARFVLPSSRTKHYALRFLPSIVEHHMIDIVGGGILGLTMAHELLKRGEQVRLWERAPTLGGLMGRTTLDELDGVEVDRYYHAILSSDRSLMTLMEEVGVRDRLRFTTT